jgi:hypothetical protein
MSVLGMTRQQALHETDAAEILDMQRAYIERMTGKEQNWNSGNLDRVTRIYDDLMEAQRNGKTA